MEGEPFPLPRSRITLFGSNSASFPALNNVVGEIGLRISEYLKISSKDSCIVKPFPTVVAVSFTSIV